ncbi:MAG TPA: glutamate--tRNA ligase [Vicinamibacterales bacterium]|jgi:glutamyl-tRNA synthetase|nr:glutamate--tRNA ligase [Vicinamibacterales bacterium]
MRLRFAPSPTGQLHVGNARTALFNWLLAKGQGGTFILRIEDTDLERSSRESERAILEDLRWMGLDWTEGVEAGGDHGPYRQTERLHIYRAHAVELLSRGAAYQCFCSTEQLEADRQAALAAGRPPAYVGRCRDVPRDEARRRIENGEKAVIRFRVPDGPRDIVFNDLVRGEVRFSTEVIGDPVLVRSDGVPAYNYAVVIDDALMQITHVIRGEDHISNTPRQLLLYEAFGWKPPAFAHVSLVMGPDHSPLSKRHGATSVAEFRARGFLPEALTNYLALIGWSPGEDQELLPVDELAARFRLEDVGHSAGVFDVEKLAWVNRHYLKAAAPDRLARLAVPYLKGAGWVSDPSSGDMSYLETVVSVAAQSVDRLEQIPARLAFLFDYSAARALERPSIAQEARDAASVIEATARELEASPPLLDRDTFRALAKKVQLASGAKGKALFHPIRIALTGEADGIELDIAVPAIERGALLARSGIVPILSARQRATEFAGALAGRA